MAHRLAQRGRQTMSPESQRVALAELCGWRFKEMVGWSQHFGPPPELSTVGMSRETLFPLPPDFLNDLNACYDAEMKMSMEQLSDMDTVLEKMGFGYVSAIHAAAPHRCEAILKACGKWVEAK